MQLIPTRHPLLWFLAAAVTAASVAGHVRLAYSVNGAPLFWSNPASIGVVIQSDGSDNINDGSDETAIRNAIAAWNGVDGTTLALIENKNAGSQARTDWASTDVHLVMFDEANDTGFFPGSSGVVAITPVTFFTSGQIVDADILFNGKNFNFTTSQALGRFDVQDVAAHELGHLIGLDHSGCAGATMYPYVDSTVILHRSLSIDDVRGTQAMYPGATFGQIMGTVTRSSNSSVVKGAHVVARDSSGRLAGATLTNSSGNFTLRALASGTYTLYADPLDAPVSGSNLGGGQTIETDFESTVFGSFAVNAGSTASTGTQSVDPDVVISLGRIADDYPLRVNLGQTTTHLVRGSGLSAGATLVASDPTLNLSSITWFGSSVQFDVAVPSGAALGHVDLTVTNAAGDRDILTAALELTPPNPTVASVTPGTGDPAGGTAVTLSGTGFNAGARVVIGDRIYVDGLPGGCTVVDSTTITLSTQATMAGDHDVVVIDASGVEGREGAAFDVATPPLIASLFPSVGASAGGTQLLLAGTDFVPGTTVTIDGVLQPNVTVESSTEITILTAAGVPGGPYVLEMTAPSGHTASTVFAYASGADPVLATVSPGSGPSAGGTTLTVVGTGFTTDTTVVFGANAKTGAGGNGAANVSLVNSTTLVVVTPASSTKNETVVVRDSVTGQAHLVAGAFTFNQPPPSSSSSFEGFGACAAVSTTADAPTLSGLLSAVGWILVALILGALRARRVPGPQVLLSCAAHECSSLAQGFSPGNGHPRL